MTQENAEVKDEDTAAVNRRFTVGKDYYFINVDITKGAESFHPIFRPWDGDVVNKIDIVKLTCAEHHKVFWRYDNDSAVPDFDGFIFTDDDGERWFNQYPKADFGQLDDSANWKVSRERRLSDSDLWASYNKAEVYLQRIADGVKRFTEIIEGEEYDEEELRMRPIAAESLQKHFDEIAALFKEKFNLTLTTEPYTVQVTNRDTGQKETHTFERRARVRLS